MMKMALHFSGGMLLILLNACTAPSAVTASGGEIQAQRPVEEYRLGTGDKVRILVFNEPTLSGEFMVNSGGALSLPLIGDVSAAGKTTNSLQGQIEAGLGNGYLREPKVSIDVLSFRPFFILGEVSKPGEYPFSSSLTILNAVATAEGFTYRAEKRFAYIRREGEREERRYKISPDLRIQPGDTIRVGERYF